MYTFMNLGPFDINFFFKSYFSVVPLQQKAFECSKQNIHWEINIVRGDFSDMVVHLCIIRQPRVVVLWFLSFPEGTQEPDH